LLRTRPRGYAFACKLRFIDGTPLSANGAAVESAVAILNFGAPTKAEEVEPFLYELFRDPDLIKLPLGLLQERFARLISARRVKRVGHEYARIGYAPLVPTTFAQVEAIRAVLGDGAPRFFVGMRYTEPSIAKLVAQIRLKPPDRLVALALFPQYSSTTTGSSFNVLSRELGKVGLGELPVHYVPAFYEHPRYLAALRALIEERAAALPDRARAHVLFSAHGLPSTYYRAGDPYPDQIKDTIRLLMRDLGWPGSYSLAYQSKVGPVSWLRPSTDEEILRLAANGVRDAIVVPLSFVSDGLETLFEIDVTFGTLARSRGMTLHRIRALDTHPDFIACLAEVLEAALADDSYQGIGKYRCVRCLLPRHHERRMRVMCPDCSFSVPDYLLRLPPVKEPLR